MLAARHSGACKTADHEGPAATYLVTIVGSAGSFEVLAPLLSLLPPTYPAAVVVALHTGKGSVLVEALRPRCPLPIESAVSTRLLRPGCIYVPPAGTHVVVNPDARITVSGARRIRRFRPSADWLLESAAASFGRRHLAIILSGVLSDGAPKCRVVRAEHGVVLVQEPETCRYPDMPRAAIATGHVDSILSIGSLAQALSRAFSDRPAGDDAAEWEDPFAGLIDVQPRNR